MDKTCGTCGKCRNTHDGPYCYKGSTPKPVSPIRTMDCWADPAEVQQPPVMTKVCTHCGRELPITNFNRHSRTKDGYFPACKECQSEMNKGHKKRQPFQHNEAPKKAPELTPEQMGIGKGRRADHPTYVDKDTGVTMKWCRACKQYKPIDEFHRNKANKDGHEFDCKVCHNARVTAQHARKRAEKKAQKEAEIQAAAHEAVEAVKKVLDEQPRVNAPAGGLRLPERLEKTVPKVVIERGPGIGDKVQPITLLEKLETAEIVEELHRRGFRCIIWMEV